MGGNPVTQDAELVQVDPSGDSLECISPASYPTGIEGAASGVLNGIPTVCGGEHSTKKDSSNKVNEAGKF